MKRLNEFKILKPFRELKESIKDIEKDSINYSLAINGHLVCSSYGFWIAQKDAQRKHSPLYKWQDKNIISFRLYWKGFVIYGWGYKKTGKEFGIVEQDIIDEMQRDIVIFTVTDISVANQIRDDMLRGSTVSIDRIRNSTSNILELGVKKLVENAKKGIVIDNIYWDNETNRSIN